MGYSLTERVSILEQYFASKSSGALREAHINVAYSDLNVETVYFSEKLASTCKSVKPQQRLHLTMCVHNTPTYNRILGESLGVGGEHFQHLL
jgi:hypothetical protein